MFYLYLDRKFVKFFTPERAERLDFNQGSFDPQQFEEWIGPLLGTKVGSESQGIIILSKGLVFGKQFSVDRPEQTEEEIQVFLQGLAIPPERIAKLKVYGENLLLLAADKSFYKPLVSLCQKIGLPVAAVIGENVLGEDAVSENLDWVMIQGYLSRISGGLRKYDFLKIESGFIKPTSYRLKTEASKGGLGRKAVKLAVVGGVLILLALGAYFGWMQRSLWQKFTASQPETEAAVPPPSEPTPTPTVKPLAKEEVKIQILNGSGVRGEAAKISGLLQKIGFADIKTGNYSGQKISSTSAQFSSKVPSGLRQEITSQLATLFSKVFTAESTPSGAFDVVITTSKP